MHVQKAAEWWRTAGLWHFFPLRASKLQRCITISSFPGIYFTRNFQMACVTNAIYCILLFIFFHRLTFEMHPGTVHRVCLAGVVCTDECPSVLISNTWVLLAKPWLKWSIGNYLPIPWTWLTKARNVLQINSYECMGIKPLVLGKGGATTHRLQGVSPKIFGKSLTVQEQLYIQTMSKWKKKGSCYSCSLWQFEVISPSSSGYNWKK